MKIEEDIRRMLDERSDRPGDGAQRVTHVRRRIGRRRRTQAVVAGTVAAAMALGAVAATQWFGGHTPPPIASGDTEAPELLLLAAAAAQQAPELTVGAGQFVFVETVQFSPAFMGPSAGPMEEVLPATPLHRQRWLSPDGRSDGGYREQDAGSAWTPILEIFGCPADDSCVPEPADFSGLPDDPDLILDYLREHPVGDEHPGTGTLGRIWSRLENGYVPPSVQAAMFTAASRLPGITLIESTVDAAGRPGVAVGLVSDSVRVDLIFDPGTYTYLGSRYVAQGPSAGLPTGTVVFESALLAVGVVDAIGQLP